MDELNKDTESQDLREEKNKKKRRKRNIFLFLRIAIIVSAAVFVLAIGDYCVIRSCKEQNATNKLTEEKEEYEQKIKETEEEINQFKEDKNHLEHQAREKYLMRKDNEDVFIVE